jgi:hypothetical protein
MDGPEALGIERFDHMFVRVEQAHFTNQDLAGRIDGVEPEPPDPSRREREVETLERVRGWAERNSNRMFFGEARIRRPEELRDRSSRSLHLNFEHPRRMRRPAAPSPGDDDEDAEESEAERRQASKSQSRTGAHRGRAAALRIPATRIVDSLWLENPRGREWTDELALEA